MRKLMKKKVSLLGKEVSVFAIVVVAMIGLASAALVPYLSGALTDNFTTAAPIELVDVDFDFTIDHSGEDGFALLRITNNADVSITGTPVLSINESGSAMTDMEGINVALSNDVQYYCTPLNDNAACKAGYMDWMNDNVVNMDWIGDETYSDAAYPSDLVVDTNSDSFDVVAFSENTMTFTSATIPAGMTTYFVVYVSTDAALRPAIYDISVVVAA